MQQVARAWRNAELTGNAAVARGALGPAYGLSQLGFSLFGCAFADRCDKRKILLLSQCVMGLLALVNGLLSRFINVM